jgi:NAD-dependent dihydropyrimidine dehydrogenase PreA subunit
MPYKITPQCSGKDTICEDICPYNCVKTLDAAPEDSHRHFQIDPEQCTDCGACALACPDAAIVYAEGFVRYQPRYLAPPAHRAPVGEWDRCEGAPARGVHIKVEVPEGFLVLDGKIESWARLFASSSN